MKRIPVFARFLIVALVVGVILVLSSAWKEMKRSDRIEDEVAKLRQEADRIRNENRSISEKIAYFSTSDFEEREAKEKLGMKNGDEQMVSVEVGSLKSPSSSAGDDTSVIVSDEANYRKWMRYFFGK